MANGRYLSLMLSCCAPSSNVLKHRDDEETLHAYLDKLQSRNQAHGYTPEEEVALAIAEYLKDKSVDA
jgi:hypothetical protein